MIFQSYLVSCLQINMNISSDLCNPDQKDGYVNITSLFMTNPNRHDLLQLYLRVDMRLWGRLYHRALS